MLRWNLRLSGLVAYFLVICSEHFEAAGKIRLSVALTETLLGEAGARSQFFHVVL